MAYLKSENIELEVYQGNITKLKVDAIVNAANISLLGGGGVDGAIHRAAGPGLLRECREIEEVSKGCRCPPGEAHITSGCHLPAKHVIHTVAPKFSGSVKKVSDDEMKTLSMWTLTKNIYKNATEGTEEDLANCYINCLKLAGANNLETIAFPSLGTGGYAIPIEIACPIAIQTVIDNVKSASSLKKVIFVCFSNSDYDMYVKTMERLAK